MSDAFIGEIRLFPYQYAPADWLFCDGSLQSIQQYQALYAVIGPYFGGDAKTTFALPDLRGRVAVGTGADPSDIFDPLYASSGGSEGVVLNSTQMPSHTHALNAAVTAASARTGTPNGNFISILTDKSGASLVVEPSFTSATSAGNPVALNAGTISASTGGSAAHENRQPYLALYYCICYNGVFPIRSS
jgi:microcystin-dependent protein